MASLSFSSENFSVANLCKFLLLLGLSTYLIILSLSKNHSQIISPTTQSFDHYSPTNLSHLVFGLLGSENAWHQRRGYIESWWRPGSTRGLLYLDKAPTGDLLPWSKASPPYRVSDDLSELFRETRPRVPVMIRMVHAIMEVMREVGRDESVRWVVMGDDDSVLFVDNIVEVVSQYDHQKYYYLGGQSEFIMSGYWFAFNQGFGGAGFILSYPLARALAHDMEGCLRRYSQLSSADLITMVCIADLGVNLSPQKGLHQIDLRGDISGFLSSHPNTPLMSLHHLDAVDPLFPNKDRFESTRHLMKAAAADQSRVLQQTICHHRQINWSVSVSWGYSVHIYERVMPRSELQNPLETFGLWSGGPRDPPRYMFNTRIPSTDPCEAPHVFVFNNVKRRWGGIRTVYRRAAPRGLATCLPAGNHSADYVSEVHVSSPTTKRKQMGRCECCDIMSVSGAKVELKLRECKMYEIIA